MTDCELDQAMSQALRSLDLAWFDQLATEADRRRVALGDKLDQPGALLAAAMWYAEQGMPVFPCAVGGKRPITRHGLHDATTDLDQIRQWWTSVPQANIGLPTGHRYDVIDIDPPDGYWSLADLKRERRLPATYYGRVLTPSGGIHLYITPSGGGNATRYRPGIDYRGKGGYVIAPPSRSGGRRWHWANPLSTTGYQTVYEWEVDW